MNLINHPDHWTLALTKRESRLILKITVSLLLFFGFPIFALYMATLLHGCYLIMNLMACFPAMNLIDFILLAVPFAAIQQIALVQKIGQLQNFQGKRKLLNALRRFR